MHELTFGHVAEREVFHFFAAIGIMHISIWAMVYFADKPACYRFLPHTLIPQLGVCGLVTLVCAFFREPMDVALVGDPWWKSYLDWVFWVVGIGLGGWDAYRKLLYCDGKTRKAVAIWVGKLRPNFSSGSEDQKPID